MFDAVKIQKNGTTEWDKRKYQKNSRHAPPSRIYGKGGERGVLKRVRNRGLETQTVEERRGARCTGTAERLLAERRHRDSERRLPYDGGCWQNERSTGRCHGWAKKLIEAFTISSKAGTNDPADELLKMNALIRANLGINPEKLTMEAYAIAYNQAIWLESFRLHNLAELVVAIFGRKEHGR